jgi:hypothetical protein
MRSITCFAVSTIFLAGLLVLSGCSTPEREAENRKWIDLFSNTDSTDSAVSIVYGIGQVESDYSVLQALSSELDALANEEPVLRRALAFKKRAYLSAQDNEQIALILFRFLNARAALWDMVGFYRQNMGSDPEIHTKGAILGMSAGLTLTSHSSRFAALFYDEKKIIRLLNSAYPSYDISAGTYDVVSDSMTSIDNLELIDLAWYLFCKDLADPNSELAIVRDSDPRFRDLITRMDRLHANTHIQTRYIIHARASYLPDLSNRLHHSRIAKLGDAIDEDIDSGIIKGRGFIFKNVSRIKNPTEHVLQFSDEQIRQIKTLLQPGDVLLTYTSGYMSNVFLPGNFKHGITYIGSVEDRRKVGLTDSLLMKRAVSAQQGRELIEHVNATTMADGYEIDIVEAVAEGVMMHSIEQLLQTHINRLAVLRPRISEEERLSQLVLLLQYVGAPYDFKFDFENDAYQCCTELVYRTINRKGEIQLPLEKMKGLWILDADGLIKYYLAQNPEAFEFILLAEKAADSKDNRANLLTGSEGLQALYDLMDVEAP